MKQHILDEIDLSGKVPASRREDVAKGKLQKNFRESVLYEQLIQMEDSELIVKDLIKDFNVQNQESFEVIDFHIYKS